MRSAADDDEVKQHSGWLIPLGLLTVIALLCAAFLLFYLRPSAYRSDQLTPTAATEPITLRIHGREFVIPANYFAYRPGRAGGMPSQVALVAVLPGFTGYSKSDASLFVGDAPDSPLLHLFIHEDKNNLSEAARLARIYMPYIVDSAGVAGPFGLTRYEFRADSGYGGDDLFVGTVATGAVVFLCVRPVPEVPSPTCLAIDRAMAPGLALSYRFKRTHLAEWRSIAEGVSRLVARFEAR